MVNSRMEGRLETLEKNVGDVKQGMSNLEREVVAMRELLSETLKALKQGDQGKAATEATHSSHHSPIPEEREKEASNTEIDREPGRFRRLELPLFSGDDPSGWIFRMQRYFNINGIRKHEKLEATVVGLEGKALNLFQWAETWQTACDWGEFKKLLLMRFGYTQIGDGCEGMMSLK